MLDGKPAVFLSCSERSKAQLARPIREALAAYGVRTIIVSDEPILPYTASDPDSKVNSYLNASNALVALCTPDNTLADGTIECRQNIIDEIQRARGKDHLSQTIQILKHPSVTLPSNVVATYDRLDTDDLESVVDVIITQLRSWGVLGREVEPAARPDPAVDVEKMIDGIGLGDHDEARRRAYALLRSSPRDAQRVVVASLVRYLSETKSAGTDVVHRASSLLEAINRLDPSLVSTEVIESLANSPDHTKRMCAAMLLWDRAEVAPAEVPLGLLGRLVLPNREDWYVWAPAMAASKLLMLRRTEARTIFDALAISSDPNDRQAAAVALLDISRIDARTVPFDLAEKLARDPDSSVSEAGSELVAVLGERSDGWRNPLSPFGL